MYRVIEMYGDFEPWWFLEGWEEDIVASKKFDQYYDCLLYTSPSPRDRQKSRMPSSA